MIETALLLPLVADARRDKISLGDNSIVVASRDLLSCDLPEGSVILDLKAGVYYGLDPVGTFVWSLIQEPRALRDIAIAMLQEYEVGPDRCNQDLKALLAEMAQKSLIEVRNGTAAQG